MTLSLLFTQLFACAVEPDGTYGDGPADGHSTDTGSTIEVIPSPEDSGTGTSCVQEDVDPYDWSRVIHYDLAVDQETIDYLEAMGYTYGETYQQVAITAQGVTITPDGCSDQPIEFSDIRLEIGREMGYVPPPGETSWIVEYNAEHGSQELGGYDDARWWAPLYDGPVLEAFLYQYTMSYVSLPGRKFAWMTLSTSYWPDSIEVVDNALEPPKEDMMDRQFGENGWVSLWEGSSWSLECQAGKCDDTRFYECIAQLDALADHDTLLEETSECFDWTGIAAEYAWEVYFGHWDGCMSPHNCLVTEIPVDGDSESSATQFGLEVTGTDLVANQSYGYTAEYVQFETWNDIQAYCWMDQSPGGCREQFVADLELLIELGQSGLMSADLAQVVEMRQSLGLWWEGTDEVWADSLDSWLATRGDYVDSALELALDPCNDWSYWYYGVAWGGGWDTGGWGGSIPGCGGGDTGTYDTASPRDTAGTVDTATVVVTDTASDTASGF